MKGLELIDTVCSSTDLPSDLLKNELRSLMEAKNLTEDNLSLEQLREIMAEYLQQVLVEAKTQLTQFES